MENFTFFPSLAGGMLIGISVSFLLLFTGRIAGISGMLQGALKTPESGRLWGFLFLVGLALGAYAFQLIAPDFNTPRQHYPLPLLASGGFLVGLGAAMANGCISGHGICGLARLSSRSLTAVSIFMVSGMVTVYIIRHVLGLTV